MGHWTDYAFKSLGDTQGAIAPVRECTVLGYDGIRYVTVMVGGVKQYVNHGYVYERYGRYGEVKGIGAGALKALPYTGF